jgi:hypothetical protein
MADTSIEIKSGSTNTVDVLGLDDVNVDFKLGLPQPFRTEATNELEVKPLNADLDATQRLTIDPLRTDSSLAVDLKPAVVDLCLTLNVGKLPNVCIKQPYHHHVGFTLFGMEVWGYTFSGEQETIIEDQHPQPRVALGAGPAGWSAPPPPPRASEPPTRETGGLRIRLGQ